MAGFSSVVVVLGSVAGRVIFWEGICEFCPPTAPTGHWGSDPAGFRRFQGHSNSGAVSRKNSSRKKKDKKLVFHLNTSFLNYSNSSLATNQPYRPFVPKVTINTKINLPPRLPHKTWLSVPSLAFQLKLDAQRLLELVAWPIFGKMYQNLVAMTNGIGHMTNFWWKLPKFGRMTNIW